MSHTSITTEGWKDALAYLLPNVLAELQRLAGRKRVEVLSVSVIRAETVQDGREWHEEIILTVWFKAGKNASTHRFAYDRVLYEYDGNRTGSYRLIAQPAIAKATGEAVPA